MKTISRKDFREIIGWNCGNYPFCTSGLSLINGLSGAEIEGAKIGENHYNLYYKYNVIKDIIHFPIIITSGDKCFIATNKTDLINSTYIWLPIEFDDNGGMIIRWRDSWDIKNEWK